MAAGWPELLPGWVWLCGAGPGDPGLLTLHGLNAVQQADVIVHDALISPEILAWAGPAAEIIDMGKRAGRASPIQARISQLLKELAQNGKRVLRLKGGDPFMFGRGGEEAQALVQAGVPIRIVPGISAGIGGLAYAGIPATHRDVNQAVIFVTGHDTGGSLPSALDWAAIAQAAQVIVIYMGMRHISEITAALQAAGRAGDEPMAVVRNASLPDQQVLETTLERAAVDVAANNMRAPAIICVGRAVLLRQALDWAAMMQGHAPRNTDPLGTGIVTGIVTGTKQNGQAG